MTELNRRQFMHRGAGAAAAAVASTVAGPAHGVVGANERIRVACVGLRWRGTDHMTYFMRLKDRGVDVPMLCDIDEHILADRTRRLEKLRGRKPVTHVDYRKVLEDKTIDAVALATPNHWHALGTVWACQAGKDVYVEKPVSWCIHEGRQMVRAARKYDRIVQVGLQRRSDPAARKAAGDIQAGLLGEVSMARSRVFKRRESIGVKRPTRPPKHVHYDLWVGPGPKVPFHENLVHYNWHWFWDFGNGEIGNSGVHRLDLVLLTLNKGLPTKVSSQGGRFGYDPPDQGQTPNTQVTTWTFDDGTMIVSEIRGRYTNSEPGLHANIFFGSEGYLAGPEGTFGFGGQPYEGGSPQTDEVDMPGDGDENHFLNFIEAMRSRRVEELNCDIEQGHRSTVLAHMANISYRLDRTLTFDPTTETFVGACADQANGYLKREYREPFVLPEQV